ncbi:MAG TPA: sugar phosphate nucleotidyltransferase [Patescibacteria group bacterium]|nr:sugar phosphate nucleotidyltransferase [Patescibacteria group bacterium]
MAQIPVVVLCGGQGTRMRGQTITKKELVQIGGRPILWHVMRIFSAYGFNRFVLTLGHESQQIRRYFLDYDSMSRDLTLKLGPKAGSNNLDFLSSTDHPDWHVTLCETGLRTDKATRIAKVSQYLTEDLFFVAYGDDVSDVDVQALVDFHHSHGKAATITAVRIELPFGVVEADESGLVLGFQERPRMEQWINGGFMLFKRSTLEMMANGDDVSLEQDVLPALAEQEQLMIYRHDGFWQSMNSMKETILLEKLWQSGAPWKVW